MRWIYHICIVVFAVLLVFVHDTPHPFFKKYWPKSTPGPKTPDGKWQFTAQRGFFSHDSDWARWKFRAKTLPNLGLLEKRYGLEYSPYDWTPEELARTQWSRFLEYLDFLGHCDPMHKRYILLYIVQSGQGVHNVKETEVGRGGWNRYWAKLPGDDNTTWFDASLTPTGEQQATDISSLWSPASKIPPPKSIYTSPLRRTLQTTALGFAPLLNQTSPITPVVTEKLRERLGVHTSDQRSPKSWIESNYPDFRIEANFTEEDELWKPDYRETTNEHIVRSQEVLTDIFDNGKGDVMALVGHEEMNMAIFGAVGWPKVKMAEGAVYPLLVCGEWFDEEEEEEEEDEKG